MLVVTMAAVGLGIFVTAPGLGILFLIAALPALVRTAIHVTNRRRSGQPVNLDSKLSIFAVSLAVTVTAATSAAVAFFSVCAGALFVSQGLDLSAQNGGQYVVILFLQGVCPLALALLLFCGVFYLFRARRKSTATTGDQDAGPKSIAEDPGLEQGDDST